ncbi:MAG: hypothetical protein WC551_12920 [Patescibacteria group bacterium]
MKAETAVKGISRIVVMLHPGQLTNGNVLPITQTDFNASDEQLNAWKRSFTESGGACIYDGPPVNTTDQARGSRVKEDA